MSFEVEGEQPAQPAVLSTADDQWGGAPHRLVPVDAGRPARRRRSAVLGGGVLVAASPVAVGAGLFVPGFAALGVGALLLLLPPSTHRERSHRSLLPFVRTPAAALGRAIAALVRGI